MKVSANSDPKCAQETVDCGVGKRGDERVREGAGESLLRERSVRVVEAWAEVYELLFTEWVISRWSLSIQKKRPFHSLRRSRRGRSLRDRRNKVSESRALSRTFRSACCA